MIQRILQRLPLNLRYPCKRAWCRGTECEAGLKLWKHAEASKHEKRYQNECVNSMAFSNIPRFSVKALETFWRLRVWTVLSHLGRSAAGYELRHTRSDLATTCYSGRTAELHWGRHRPLQSVLPYPAALLGICKFLLQCDTDHLSNLRSECDFRSILPSQTWANVCLLLKSPDACKLFESLITPFICSKALSYRCPCTFNPGKALTHVHARAKYSGYSICTRTGGK